MVYYKIVNSQGNVVEYNTVEDIDSFLDVKGESESSGKGLYCEKIDVLEYKQLQITFRNNQPTIDYVYVTQKIPDEADEEEYSFKLTATTKRKLLILEFFKEKEAPTVELLESYYQWFIKDENRK